MYFDHPVAGRAWYWPEDAPEWQETFERADESLAHSSDEQLDQGFQDRTGGAASRFEIVCAPVRRGDGDPLLRSPSPP